MPQGISLLDKLGAMVGKLDNTDPAWVVFITDHIDYVKRSSTVIGITDAIRDRYRHKFEHFMRDQSCNRQLIWVAKMINDLETYSDFTLKQVVMIPDTSTITDLYRKYRTSRNND